MATVVNDSATLVGVWLYRVLNPIVHGLAAESARLRRRNLGFQPVDRKLDSLIRIGAMVSPSQKPNLEQFLRRYPDLRSRFEAHDEMLTGLEQRAGIAYDQLIASPEFETLTIGRETKRPALAQYVVNSVQRLPEFYELFADWQEIGARVLALREAPLLASAFSALADEIVRFDKEAAFLESELTQMRDDLADEYGLPAVASTAA